MQDVEDAATFHAGLDPTEVDKVSQMKNASFVGNFVTVCESCTLLPMLH
jgi:hypothetical protein